MCILELALAAQMRMSFGKRKSFFFQMDQAYAPYKKEIGISFL